MDLALEMGTTVGALTRTMTEHELVDWLRYAEKKGLPSRRMEIYLAQLAMVMARTMGGSKDAKTQDFLLPTKDDSEPVESENQLEEAKAAFGFAPRRMKT